MEKGTKFKKKKTYYYAIFNGHLKSAPFTSKTKKGVLGYFGEKWTVKLDRLFEDDDAWWTLYKGAIIVRLEFHKIKTKTKNSLKF